MRAQESYIHTSTTQATAPLNPDHCRRKLEFAVALPTLMSPVPSLFHNGSLRLGLVISASQIIILPTRLNPLTPATQSVHFSLPGSPQSWHLFFGQFLMTLSSNITSSLSLYWSCTEVCSRNHTHVTQSCHSSHSITIYHDHLSFTFSKSPIPSYNPS